MLNRDSRPVTVLIVEDDPGHARLIEKNLTRAGFDDHPVIKVSDGQQALDLLFEQGAFAGVSRPSPLLVLLDLDMPMVSGYMVLERMKADPATQEIPVVVLSSVDDPEKIRRCYALGANIFITKPVQYERFATAVHELGLFMSLCAVPKGD